jgi:hypothetical protein
VPRERDTREVIDPVTGKEYSVDVIKNAGGVRVNVRDNEMGTTIQTGDPTPNLTIILDEARQVEETEHIVGGIKRAERDDDELER